MCQVIQIYLLFLVAGCVMACHEPTARLKARIEEPLPFEPLEVNAMPKWTQPVLARGQEVYIEHCERCHRIGKAGAPRTGDKPAWQQRVNQGMDTLIQHAIHGYESPSGHEMPARGGSPELIDEDVAAAVRLMIHLSVTNHSNILITD